MQLLNETNYYYCFSGITIVSFNDKSRLPSVVPFYWRYDVIRPWVSRWDQPIMTSKYYQQLEAFIDFHNSPICANLNVRLKSWVEWQPHRSHTRDLLCHIHITHPVQNETMGSIYHQKFHKLQNFLISCPFGTAWKCMKMLTNKPMFGRVVPVLTCSRIFIKHCMYDKTEPFAFYKYTPEKM